MPAFANVHLDADAQRLQKAHDLWHDGQARQQVEGILRKTSVFEQLQTTLLLAERQRDMRPELVYILRANYDHLHAFVSKATWPEAHKTMMLAFMTSYLDATMVNHREICIEHLKTLLLPNQPFEDEKALIEKMRHFFHEQSALLQKLDWPSAEQAIMMSGNDLTKEDVLRLKNHLDGEFSQAAKPVGEGVGYFRKWLRRYHADIKLQVSVAMPWVDGQVTNRQAMDVEVIAKDLDDFNHLLRSIVEQSDKPVKQPLDLAKMRLTYLHLAQQVELVSDASLRQDLLTQLDDIDECIDQAVPLTQEVFVAQLVLLAQDFENNTQVTSQQQLLLLHQVYAVLEDQADSFPVLRNVAGHTGRSYEDMAALRLQAIDLRQRVCQLAVDDKIKHRVLDRLEKTINQMAPMSQEVYDNQVQMLLQAICRVDERLCQAINHHELHDSHAMQLAQLYQKLDDLLNDKAKNCPWLDDRDALFKTEGERLKMFDQTLTGNQGKIGGIKRFMGVTRQAAYVQTRAEDGKQADRCIAGVNSIAGLVEKHIPQTLRQDSSQGTSDNAKRRASGLKRS